MSDSITPLEYDDVTMRDFSIIKNVLFVHVGAQSLKQYANDDTFVFLYDMHLRQMT